MQYKFKPKTSLGRALYNYKKLQQNDNVNVNEVQDMYDISFMLSLTDIKKSEMFTNVMNLININAALNALQEHDNECRAIIAGAIINAPINELLTGRVR